MCSLGYPTAPRTESGGEALQLAAALEAEDAPAGGARAAPGPSKLLQLPGLVQEASGRLLLNCGLADCVLLKLLQACCRASSALLSLWQIVFREEQQGCMCTLHHQENGACSQPV